MNIQIHALATTLLILLLVSTNWAKSDFPVEFQGIVPEYHNAGVVKKKHTRKSTTVFFSTKEKGKTILAFYDDSLIEKGWVKIDSIWDGISDMGSFKYKMKNKILFLIVDKKKDSENTKFSIRLDVLGGRE